MTCYERLISEYRRDGVIMFYGRKIPLSRVVSDIDKFAYSLQKLGFQRGDALTIYLPTSLEAIVAFYACSKVGVIANIVHPLMPINALKKSVVDTRSKGIMYLDALTNRGNLGCINATLIECSVSDYEGILYPFYKAYGLIKCRGQVKHIKYCDLIKANGSVDVSGNDEDIVVTMHSGGTDGSPKTVCLSNRALNALSDNLEPLDKKGKTGDYSLVMLPIFHAFGLGVSVHTALLKGYNLCLMTKFSARGVCRYIRHLNISMIAGVPVMFKKILSDKAFKGKGLRRLSDIWCGGDVLYEEDANKFNEKIMREGGTARIMRGYGLTETSSVCAVSTKDTYKEGSSGRAILNTDIKIIKDDEVLSANEVGEIVVHTEQTFTSYLDGTTSFIEIGGKSYVRTGDLGYLDEDGFLFIKGRIKRTVKINAINIYPLEVEEIIRGIDGVKDVAVIDYIEDGKIKLKAYVVGDDKERIKSEIINRTSRDLIKYSRVSSVEFIDRLPLTSIGKVDYKKLK